MQKLNWNDLRYLLAVKRGGSLSAAARLMAVNDTTVSRRLAVLRLMLGEDLVFRQPDGTLLLTDEGERAAAHIEAMEQAADVLGDTFAATGTDFIGTVRITSVPFLVNRWLAPLLGDLLRQHSGLRVDLIPDSRDLSLTLRETDIAVRFARPTAGGSSVIARRVGRLAFSAYSAGPSAPDQDLPWILYDDAMAHLPQARWLARKVKQTGARAAGLRVHDIETAIEAVAAGVGKSLLPEAIADRLPAVRKLDAGPVNVSREVWLLTHRSRHGLRRVSVVSNWIASLFQECR